MLPAGGPVGERRTVPPFGPKSAPHRCEGGQHDDGVAHDLNVHVAIGDEVIRAEELFELADLKVPLVRFRGQWVEIDADEIRAAADFWSNRDQLTLREAVRIGVVADQQAKADNVSLATAGWLSELQEGLQQKSRIRLLDAPAGFDGELRLYQQFGYSWLVSSAGGGWAPAWPTIWVWGRPFRAWSPSCGTTRRATKNQTCWSAPPR